MQLRSPGWGPIKGLLSGGSIIQKPVPGGICLPIAPRTGAVGGRARGGCRTLPCNAIGPRLRIAWLRQNAISPEVRPMSGVRRLIAIAIAFAAAVAGYACGSAPVGPETAAATQQARVPGEYIVTLTMSADAKAISDLYGR